MMNTEDLYYYIKQKTRGKAKSGPGKSTWLKGKLQDYKDQGRPSKQSIFLQTPTDRVQEIVRVRGETEDVQKSITLLQRTSRGIEQYREILQHIIDDIKNITTDETAGPSADNTRESIRMLLDSLDQLAHSVRGDLLSQAYAPQKRVQEVLVRDRDATPAHPYEIINRSSEQFNTMQTFILEERFGPDRIGPVLEVIKVDSVRTVRNFFTAGGLEETRETFTLTDGNTVFSLKRPPKLGTEIVVVNRRIVPRAKPETPAVPGYSIEGHTLQLHGLTDYPEGKQMNIEFWTDTSLNRFHLTQPTIPSNPITAVTIKNHPVPCDSENGYSLEEDTIILHGAYVPKEGDDVQVTFNTGIQVRFLDVRIDPSSSCIDVEINGIPLNNNQFSLVDQRLFFNREAQPRHGDLVIIRESMDPLIRTLELTRKPLPGSVTAHLKSRRCENKKITVQHTGKTVILQEELLLESHDVITVDYRVQEPVHRLDLQHKPIPGSVTVTMVPDDTEKTFFSSLKSGWIVKGSTVILTDRQPAPGIITVTYRWRDRPTHRHKPELPLTLRGTLVVPLDKPLINPAILTVTVNDNQIPKHKFNGYSIINNTVELKGSQAPQPGDEISVSYEFGKAAAAVYCGTRNKIGKEAELPIDITLTGVNLDTIDLETSSSIRKSELVMKSLSTWLLQKETKLRAQLARAEMTLSGMLRRQEALSRRTFRQRRDGEYQKPEMIKKTYLALTGKSRAFISTISALKPTSASVLLDEDTLPWCAMLQEKPGISLYC
ncbi:MAG: hypothetical protein QGH40_15155 [bacterium]|nr:hypothetical protein [bacterium]